MQPKPIADTCSPVDPNTRCSMTTLRLARASGTYRASANKNSLKRCHQRLTDDPSPGHLFILNSTRGRTPPRPRSWSHALEVQTHRTPGSTPQPHALGHPSSGDRHRAAVARGQSREPPFGRDRSSRRLLARALVSFGRELQRRWLVLRQRGQRAGTRAE